MSGDNYSESPKLSVREAAENLFSELVGPPEGPCRIVDIGVQKAVEKLADALAEPERSRPGLLPDVDHALGAIGAMKRQEPITPEDIRAIVALAEEGADQLRLFDVRWNADMRAIERWRAGDGLPSWARALMGEAVALFREYERHHDRKFVLVAKKFGAGSREALDAHAKVERNAKMAEKIEAELDLQRPGGGELVWPDHADLVVWLMQVFDVEIDGPAVLDVQNMISRLEAQRASGGLPIYGEAAALMGQMAEALRKTARRAFLAEERARKLESERNTRSPSIGDALAFALAGRPDIDYRRVGNVERLTASAPPATIDVEHAAIPKGHNVRAEASDGRRYEGVATEDGRARLALVPQIGEESADGE